MQIHPCPECRALTQKWGSQTVLPLLSPHLFPRGTNTPAITDAPIIIPLPYCGWNEPSVKERKKKRSGKKLPPVSFCEIYNFFVVVRKWTNGYQCNEGIFLIGLPGFSYWYSLQRIPQEMNFFLWRTALFFLFLPSSCIFSIRPGFKICPSISGFP